MDQIVSIKEWVTEKDLEKWTMDIENQKATRFPPSHTGWTLHNATFLHHVSRQKPKTTLPGSDGAPGGDLFLGPYITLPSSLVTIPPCQAQSSRGRRSRDKTTLCSTIQNVITSIHKFSFAQFLFVAKPLIRSRQTDRQTDTRAKLKDHMILNTFRTPMHAKFNIFYQFLFG